MNVRRLKNRIADKTGEVTLTADEIDKDVWDFNPNTEIPWMWAIRTNLNNQLYDEIWL